MTNPTPPPVAPLSDDELRDVFYLLDDVRYRDEEHGARSADISLEDARGIRATIDAARAQCGEAERERTRLHKLVALARNYIDPAEHPDWDAEAYIELETCDTLGNRLAHAEDQVIREVAAREHWVKERDTLTQQAERHKTTDEWKAVWLLLDEAGIEPATLPDRVRMLTQQLAEARRADAESIHQYELAMERGDALTQQLAARTAEMERQKVLRAAVEQALATTQNMSVENNALRFQVARLREVLAAITRAETTYSKDPLEHARDCVAELRAMAQAALTPDPGAEAK